MENFEKILIHMSKPRVKKLRHQDLLGETLMKAKDRSVVSWWWLSIPVYVIIMLIMKSMYNNGTTLTDSLNELKERDKYFSLFIFIIIPLLLIILNSGIIRKIYLQSWNHNHPGFIKHTWINILVILFSVIMMIIYLL